MPEAGTYYECVKIKRYWGEGETKIPDSVTEIENSAFCGCTGLTSLTIPDSVTKIGKAAFDDCPNLSVTCSPDSCARKYCEENNIPFKS